MKKMLFIAICSLFTTMTMAQKFEKDVFTTKNGKTIELSFIKHATLMIKFDNKIIHIDPLCEYADYDKMPKADLILITHDHYDHLDLEAIKKISGSNTKILSNKTSYEKILAGEVMKNGDRKSIDGWMDIEAFPAYNTTQGREQFHPNNGRDNGYVLTLDGTRIYVAGDTEDIKEMGNLQQIDIAFLPMNQPYTMTPAQGVSAAKMFSPKILYPYHYGDTNPDELKDLQLKLKGHNIEVRIRQMQ